MVWYPEMQSWPGEYGPADGRHSGRKNLIKGQLLFFRGWFHFMLIQYFGGLPYIDKVLPSDVKLTLPRLSYQECANKAAADFRKQPTCCLLNGIIRWPAEERWEKMTCVSTKSWLWDTLVKTICGRPVH